MADGDDGHGLSRHRSHLLGQELFRQSWVTPQDTRRLLHQPLGTHGTLTKRPGRHWPRRGQDGARVVVRGVQDDARHYGVRRHDEISARIHARQPDDELHQPHVLTQYTQDLHRLDIQGQKKAQLIVGLVPIPPRGPYQDSYYSYSSPAKAMRL